MNELVKSDLATKLRMKAHAREFVEKASWLELIRLIEGLAIEEVVELGLAFHVYKAFLALSDDARAEKWLDLALANAPENATLHRAKGVMHQKRREWPQAVECFRAALALRPDNAVFRGCLGVGLFYAGDYAGASQALQTALDADPTRRAWWIRLARSLVHMNELSDAVTAYGRALQIQDDGPTRSAMDELLRQIRTGSRAASSAYYDAVYADSHKYDLVGAQSDYATIWRRIVDLLYERGATGILDLGCGPGQFAEFVAAHLPGVAYTGLDFSGVAITKARKRCPQFLFEKRALPTGDFANLPAFDVVVCTEVLEHVEPDRDLLAALPAGTRVIASVPDFDAFGHLRVFRTEDKVRARYGDLLNPLSVHHVPLSTQHALWLLDGTCTVAAHSSVAIGCGHSLTQPNPEPCSQPASAGSDTPEIQSMTAKTDLKMQGRATIASYRGMLESLLETRLPAITHGEAWTRQRADDRYLCVRHDVDHNLDIALEMGRIEHELGIRATYFLLPPGDYDKTENYYGEIVGRTVRQHRRLREGALELAALGHEIGLHNDFVQLGTRLQRSVEDLIVEQIAYFRGAGIEVIGSASHGSRFARAHGFLNYEIFAECVRANKPARTVALPEGARFQTLAIPMGPLGLAYEAYSLKRDVYISDSGSCLHIGKEQYESLTPAMLFDAVGSARKVVALIHPDWWKVREPASALTALPALPALAASDGLPAIPVAGTDASGARTDTPIFVRADAKPFRIAIRGDCCSRRAMLMNRALFPKGVELVINEKCPNSCFVDTLKGRRVPAGTGDAVSDVASMTGSLRHYYLGQFERSVLDARDIDLLVFDTYADMNYELWRHRAEGWSLWVHPKFLRQPEALRRDFENIGRATVEQAVEAMCAVIDRVRSLNPGVPVMVLNQPVEYYPKLKNRTDFYRAGDLLAARRHGVYAAAALPHGELVPADVGSCGPGMTLHFDGPTYLKMITDAWRKGLGAHLRQGPAAGV